MTIQQNYSGEYSETDSLRRLKKSAVQAADQLEEFLHDVECDDDSTTISVFSELNHLRESEEALRKQMENIDDLKFSDDDSTMQDFLMRKCSPFPPQVFDEDVMATPRSATLHKSPTKARSPVSVVDMSSMSPVAPTVATQCSTTFATSSEHHLEVDSQMMDARGTFEPEPTEDTEAVDMEDTPDLEPFMLFPRPSQELRSDMVSQLFQKDPTAKSLAHKGELAKVEQSPIDLLGQTMHQTKTRHFISQITQIMEEMEECQDKEEDVSLPDGEERNAWGVRKEAEEDLHITVFGLSEDSEDRPSNMFVDEEDDQEFFAIEKESLFKRATKYLFGSSEYRRSTPKMIMGHDDYATSGGIAVQ